MCERILALEEPYICKIYTDDKIPQTRMGGSKCALNSRCKQILRQSVARVWFDDYTTRETLEDLQTKRALALESFKDARLFVTLHLFYIENVLSTFRLRSIQYLYTEIIRRFMHYTFRVYLPYTFRWRSILLQTYFIWKEDEL